MLDSNVYENPLPPNKDLQARIAIYRNIREHGLDPQQASSSRYGSATPTSHQYPVLHGNVLNPALTYDHKDRPDGGIPYGHRPTYYWFIKNAQTGNEKENEYYQDWGDDREKVRAGHQAYTEKGLLNLEGYAFWQKHILPEILYEESSSFFPVIAECPWDDSTDYDGRYPDKTRGKFAFLCEEWKERIRSSMLIISRLPPANSHTQIHPGFCEYTTPEKVPANAFITILIHQDCLKKHQTVKLCGQALSDYLFKEIRLLIKA